MSVAIVHNATSKAPDKRPDLQVLITPVSSRLDDFGVETRPHLPHACCSGEAGHCYPRIKAGG
jgi:hypothetical protein